MKRAPDNVGESTTRRGEDVAEQEGKEPGRHEAKKKGVSRSPAGKSTARDFTSVNPGGPSSAEDEKPKR